MNPTARVQNDKRVPPFFVEPSPVGANSFARAMDLCPCPTIPKKKFSDKLLTATLILANKLLGKERIKELREEIKMPDIIEVAMEKGQDEGEQTDFKKGEDEGRDEGELIGIQKMLMALLMEKFSPIPQHVAMLIK